MDTYLLRRWIGCTALLCGQTLYAATIGISPGSQTTVVGSSVNVSLGVSGLGAGSGPSVGAYDVNITFNPVMLQLITASFGDPGLGDQLDVDGSGSVQIITPSLGTVELFELSLDSIDDLNNLQASSFTLATLTFQAIGVGSSPVPVTINALSDAYGDVLPATVQSGTVNVSSSSVPEPQSVSIVTIGLFGISIFIRNRRTQ